MNVKDEELEVEEPGFEVVDGVQNQTTEVEHEHEQEEQAEVETEEVAEGSEKQESDKEVSKSASQTDEEEVREYGQKVQKRIRKLTGKLREAERREQAAIQYAQGVQGELAQQKTHNHKQDETLFGEYNSRIDVELDQAKARLKAAYNDSDTDAIIEANQVLARLSVEQENLKRVKTKREQTSAQAPPVYQQPIPQRPAPQQHKPVPDPRAEKWADENDWFGDDEVMTSAALIIHRKLIKKGVDTTSELYYNTLNKELKDNFPNKFSDDSNSPQQTVAGARRTVRSNRPNKVKLTQSQISIANRLGVPLEQYAKQVQRIQS